VASLLWRCTEGEVRQRNWDRPFACRGSGWHYLRTSLVFSPLSWATFPEIMEASGPLVRDFQETRSLSSPSPAGANGEFFDEARAADVHVQHIRKKIEPDPKNPRYIQTVRSAGYTPRPALPCPSANSSSSRGQNSCHRPSSSCTCKAVPLEET
jgi:hypothetical protein